MTSQMERPLADRAGKREWWGLALLAVPALFINYDLTALYLALPEIASSLRADSVQQLWIVDIYAFMVAGLMMTMGSLGDRIGRRNLLLVGSAIFGVASLAAALSTSVEMLIASRVLLGIGAATYAPCSLALLRNMFLDAKQRSTAVGVWMACFMGGSILGPVIGGAILSAFWWGAVFLPAVPVMAAVLLLGRALIPEYRSAEAGRLDAPSTVLSLVGILVLIWGLKGILVGGAGASAVVALVVGVLVLAVFARRQLRIADPLVDMSLFGDRIYRGAFLLSFLGGGLIGGALLLVNIYLQTVSGLDPLTAGLLIAPTGLAMLVGIGIGQGLSQKFRPASVIGGGLLVSAVGFLLITQVTAEGSTMYLLLAWALAFGGLGPATAIGYDMILASAPPEKAGSASGTVEAAGQLGTALGIAVVGSVATLIYQARIVVPAGLDEQAGAGVRDSITRASSELDAGQGEVAAEAIAQAREAFAGALNGVALLTAIAFVLMGAFAAVTLRSFTREAPAEQAVAVES